MLSPVRVEPVKGGLRGVQRGRDIVDRSLLRVVRNLSFRRGGARIDTG